jgi:hypothetical protein
MTATRRRGIVVSIDSRAPRQQVVKQESSTAPVTQARLAQGLELYLEEMRVTRAARKFRMQLEADLTAGSEIEPGDLLFDPELKIVRRKSPGAIANR